jgi:hypothetical protein
MSPADKPGTEAERARLEELNAKLEEQHYFSGSTEAEMMKVLRNELKWLDIHDQQLYQMQEEWEIHNETIRQIGGQLDYRGGFALMEKVFKKLPGNRTLEHLWDGIGDWLG